MIDLIDSNMLPFTANWVCEIHCKERKCLLDKTCHLSDHLLRPQVLFGTADGQVIVMDCHGRMLAHVLLHESDGIVSMSWNCPDFLVEDSTESDTDSDDNFMPLGTNSLAQNNLNRLTWGS